MISYIESRFESDRLVRKLESMWWREGYPWARAWVELIPEIRDTKYYQVRSNVDPSVIPYRNTGAFELRSIRD